MLTFKQCEIDGCERSKRSSGSRYCEVHYYRIRRTGSHELRTYPPAHIGSDGYVHDYDRARSGFHRQHRRILWEKIGPGEHACYHCGRLLSWDRQFPKQADGLVVDHLDNEKTNNDPSNLVPSCGVCNILRGVPQMIASKRNKNGVHWNGQTLLLREWAERIGISSTQLSRRLKDWTIDRAMTTEHCGTGPRPRHAGRKQEMQ